MANEPSRCIAVRKKRACGLMMWTSCHHSRTRAHRFAASMHIVHLYSKLESDMLLDELCRFVVSM